MEQPYERGDDAKKDPLKRMSDLVRDNAFLAMQVDNLERGLKKQQEDFESKLEMDTLNMAAEILILTDEVESVRMDNSEMLVGLQEHLKLKDDEIMKLKIEIKRQKTLNNQLQIEVMSYMSRPGTAKNREK